MVQAGRLRGWAAGRWHCAGEAIRPTPSGLDLFGGPDCPFARLPIGKRANLWGRAAALMIWRLATSPDHRDRSFGRARAGIVNPDRGRVGDLDIDR